MLAVGDTIPDATVWLGPQEPISLREVVEHYNKGGVVDLGGETIGTLDEKIKPLNLTEQEIVDLVAFLETLTSTLDPAITTGPTVPAKTPFP
jgi:hypothetical protein